MDNDLLYDNRRTLIQMGQKVAYNWSGQVAVGFITNINVKMKLYESDKRYHKIIRIKIRQVAPNTNHPMSTLTSEKNLLVLNE